MGIENLFAIGPVESLNEGVLVVVAGLDIANRSGPTHLDSFEGSDRGNFYGLRVIYGDALMMGPGVAASPRSCSTAWQP